MSSEVHPGQSLGRYVVETAIGAGGFATVYRARDTVLDRPVALKVLDPSAHRNPTVARRFLLEGRAVASLDHPAIVPVYDAGEHDDLLFMAMRLIDGRSLDAVLDGGRRMAPDEVVALVERIGPALDSAHAHGVVHRDVKPSNILLEGDDPAQAWLADFGIAATARTAGRYTTGTLGTAAYMAPEQARPSEVGPAADVYSLACVAYELVAGRRPFPGNDHIGLLMAHASDPVPVTGVAAVDEVLGRALAKDPADRPRSGAIFAVDLRTALLAPGRPAAGAAPAVAAPAAGEHRPPPAPPPAPPSALGEDATVLSTDAAMLHAPTVAEDRTMQYAPVRPPPAAAGPPAVAPGPARRAGPPPPPPPPPPPLRPAPGSGGHGAGGGARPGPPAAPVRAADLPRPRLPTVARRGASQGRRNLIIGAVVLVMVAGAVALSSLRGGDDGPTECDAAGVCFSLPAGWSVGEVQAGQVRLERDQQVVASYTHESTPTGDPVAALAGAASVDCVDEPRAARLGDADGARCTVGDGGATVAAIDGGLLWLVTLAGDVPEDEAADFVESLTFG